MTTETVLPKPVGALRSIDHLLGAGEHRFLSSGFRRVRHRLRELTVETGPAGGTVHATASVDYPPDWSRKAAGVARRPHLSVVDGLLIAAQLAEALLTRRHALDEEQRRRMWLRRLVMRSGSRPQEHLDAFPVSARHDAAEATRTTDGAWSSPVEARIGTLRVHAVFAHRGAEATGNRRERYATTDDLLGPAGQRYFGDLYRHRRASVEDVRMDLPGLRVDAILRLTPEPGAPTPTSGLEAAYHPSLSVVDAAMGVAQLAQALLYELDGIHRADSDTMWMRRIVVDRTSPVQPIDRPLPISTSAVRSLLLTTHGGIWRALDLLGELPGYRATYAIAHRLPAPPATHQPPGDGRRQDREQP